MSRRRSRRIAEMIARRYIEHGRNNPKLTTVIQLARAFGISAAELLRDVR